MDRYVSLNTRTMKSACSVNRSERVVGVAIVGVLALLHMRGLSWRRAPSDGEANPEAAAGFAEA
jgi:hypothetical protein